MNDSSAPDDAEFASPGTQEPSSSPQSQLSQNQPGQNQSSQKQTAKNQSKSRSRYSLGTGEQWANLLRAESEEFPIDEARLVPNWSGLQWLALSAGGGVVTGIILQNPWIGVPAALVSLVTTLLAMWGPMNYILVMWIPRRYRQFIIPILLLLVSLGGGTYFVGLSLPGVGLGSFNWDAFGALAELFGAIGQIMVAFLALYVAWRQYVISRDLTTQQNRITQQQTIDAYFQGISDLVLDEEGLLEDWPPERAIAEGRTASILTGLNAEGKAKIVRFLSSARLLTPLKRDRRLGRPIFDGLGGYEEDIEYGVRVIDLGSMLANADLSLTDLRNTDLSDANLVNANLQGCDFHRANLARSILFGADLQGADLYRVRLFYGTPAQARPRDRIHPPNYTTGAYTGAVVENADLTGAKNMTDEQRQYVCMWGGEQTRTTVPGGCQDIPSRLS